MGYYTQFEINIENDVSLLGKSKVSEIEDAVENIGIFEISGNAEYGWSCYDKWYYYTEDMCNLSKKFPGVLFSLHGDGEETEDLWIEYYLDGKYQRCSVQITFEKFDPDKLSEYEKF